MPNTGKSHHQPHAFAAAREKQLQSQQPLQPSAPPPFPPATTTPFVPTAPLSARPFMTMVAPAPLAALQLPPPPQYRSHHLQYQPLHSPSSYPPPAVPADQIRTNGAAFGLYERVQQTPRAAWREEGEQRTFAGVKRPAPHSPIASPQRSYEPSRGFVSPPLPQGASALPTLSCMLQRNADSSLATTPSPSLHNGDSELSHHHYVNHKRQQMFASPTQLQQRDDHHHLHHEQLEYEQHYGPAAVRGPISVPMASLYGRNSLAGVDNDHLRSILEKEIAVYNQRPTHSRQMQPTTLASSRYEGALASARYEAANVKYNRPRIVYSNDEDHPESYVNDEADSLSYQTASPPPSQGDEHSRLDSSSRVFPRYDSNGYTSSSNSNNSRLPSGNSHADYSSVATIATDSPRQQQQQHERLMHRDSSAPPSRSYGDRTDATSLRSPLQSQHTTQPRSRYATSGMSKYDSLPSTSRRDGFGASSTSSSSSSSGGGRAVSLRTTTTTTSGYRGRVQSAEDENYDDPQHVSGEAVIEAASGLVEERSPSKRESITKLLLKSKEFLKAKSLVRNRNNEIDWVATFLNVGFEASSIYSLMCPLRKGRWKVEEEAYTMELLRLIESGTVRLRHGQSVRGFIAKKLHSDDMRVLKKLSNCKMFHFARAITPHTSEEEEIDESVPGAAAALGRLEKQRSEFLRSVQLEALVAVRKYLSDSSIRELLNGRD